jgi:hypothetical protein
MGILVFFIFFFFTQEYGKMKYAPITPAMYSVVSQWQVGARRLQLGQIVKLGKNRSEYCTLDQALAGAEYKTATTRMVHFVCKRTYSGWEVISKKV